ncbi:hypothetical protein [Dyella koreensis]|uniref:Uncharacterized protein n=1 Tax=Dyella koreensis TaxID=311235 RepID=A0ABW8K055_9GAMM
MPPRSVAILKSCLGLAVFLMLLGAWLASTAHAQTAPAADYSGAWRLDDRNSDSADAVTSLMRDAARKEAPPSTDTPSADHPQGGHRGGGAGMGHGGMGGGGHGMRGGKGGKSASTDDSSGESFHKDYPLPPLLKTDSVLLVQQDAKAIQLRLNDGQMLDVKLDGQARQALNGNAMVSGRREGGQLQISFRFADGSQLNQRWVMSPDGKQLTVSAEWRVPDLQPVNFKRSYVVLR